MPDRFPPRRGRRLAGPAIAVAAAVLLAACLPLDEGPDSETSTPQILGKDPKPATCVDAGPRTRDFLPQFPDGTTRSILNPCLKLTELAGTVNALLSNQEDSSVRPFRSAVTNLVGKVLAINDLVRCGYETDRLALGIYQDHATPWSVGLAAVTRGRIDALRDVSQCFLHKQIPYPTPADAPVSDRPTGPEPQLCADTRHRHRGGEDYTVVWIGSSDTMCAQLTHQLTPGEPVDDAVTATVKATPNLAVRTGTSTSTTLIQREAAGTILLVTCYQTGETISGRRGTSNRWYRIIADDSAAGYASGAWLDTGDNPNRPPPCR